MVAMVIMWSTERRGQNMLAKPLGIASNRHAVSHHFLLSGNKQAYYLLCVCARACIHLHVSMHALKHMCMHAYTCRWEARGSTLDVLLPCSPPYFLRYGLSRNLELTNLVKLTGSEPQKSPSLPP